VTRLNAFLARSGVASRRAADKLISSGVVKVNGRVSPPEGVLIDPDRDEVTVEGRTVRPLTTHRYLILNKPLGVITTAKDEGGRTTVLDVVGDEGMGGHRLFPVGRLDRTRSPRQVLRQKIAEGPLTDDAPPAFEDCGRDRAGIWVVCMDDAEESDERPAYPDVETVS